MATLTVYPDSNPESSTVDGLVYKSSGGDFSWADIRNEPALAANDSATSDNILLIGTSSNSGQWKYLLRSYFLFDTSSLGAGATITAATFDFYANSKTEGIASQSIVLVGSTPASNTALTTNDYDQTGSTAYSSTKTVASVTTSAYNSLTLNATGLAAIDKTGITKLACRCESDRANSEPTWASNTTTTINADYAEGTNKPRLTITYTSAGGGTQTTSFFM